MINGLLLAVNIFSWIVGLAATIYLASKAFTSDLKKYGPMAGKYFGYFALDVVSVGFCRVIMTSSAVEANFAVNTVCAALSAFFWFLRTEAGHKAIKRFKSSLDKQVQ